MLNGFRFPQVSSLRGPTCVKNKPNLHLKIVNQNKSLFQGKWAAK